MSQIFTHILVWLQSLSIFRKRSINMSKSIGLVLSIILLVAIIFSVFVYIKMMQVPKFVDQMDHLSSSEQSEKDTLNIFLSHKFTNNNDEKLDLHLPEFPEIEEIIYEKPGIYWTWKVKRTTKQDTCNAVGYADKIKNLNQKEYSVFNFNLFLKEVPNSVKDSLLHLDYFSFDAITTSIPSIMMLPFQINHVSRSSYQLNKSLDYDYYAFMYGYKDMYVSAFGTLDDFVNFNGVRLTNDSIDSYKVFGGYSMSYRNHSNNPWRKLYDVSRIDYHLKLPKNAYTKSVCISFGGPTEFLNIYPSPDEIGRNFILYTDSVKLKKLQEYDLRLAAKFPYSENIQNMRIFVMTSVVTVLLTLFFRQVYVLSEPLLKKVRTKSAFILLIMICLLLILFLVLCLRPILLQPDYL